MFSSSPGLKESLVKPYFALLAAAAAISAAAQTPPAAPNNQCLSDLQQAELRTRSAAITQDIANKRRQPAPPVAGGLTMGQAVAQRDERSNELTECGVAAKKAGKTPLMACEAELKALRAAAETVELIDTAGQTRLLALQQEERTRLKALRDEYPACDGTKAASN
jgi:hypothetical protein